MIRSFYFLLFLLLPFKNLNADKNKKLNFKKILSLVTEKNPDYLLQKQKIKKFPWKKKQVKLPYNPEIELEFEEIAGQKTQGLKNLESTLKYSIKKKSKRKTSKLIKKIEAEKQKQKFMAKAFLYESQYQVTQLFIEYLNKQQKRSLLKEHLKLAKEILRIVSLKVSSGKSSPIEEMKASHHIKEINIKMKSLLNEGDIIKRKMAAFWASNTGNYAIETPLQKKAVRQSVLKIKSNLQSHPEIVNAQNEIKLLERILAFQRVELSRENEYQFGVKNKQESNDTSVLFGFNFPLVGKNKNQGKVDETLESIGLAKAIFKNIEFKFQTNANESLFKLKKIIEIHKALKQTILPSAKKLHSATEISFREGKISYLYLLDSQKQLLDVKEKLLENQFSFNISLCHYFYFTYQPFTTLFPEARQ